MAAVSSSGHAGLAVPIFVAVDRDGGARVREDVLWKLGGVLPSQPLRCAMLSVPFVATRRAAH